MSSMNVNDRNQLPQEVGTPATSSPETQKKPSSLYEVKEGKLVRMDPVTKEMRTYSVKVGGEVANSTQLEAMAQILNEHLSDVNIEKGMTLTIKLKPERVTYYTKDQSGTLVGTKTQVTRADHGERYQKLADTMKVLISKVETAASKTFPAQENSIPASKAAHEEPVEKAMIDLETPAPSDQPTAAPAKQWTRAESTHPEPSGVKMGTKAPPPPPRDDESLHAQEETPPPPAPDWTQAGVSSGKEPSHIQMGGHRGVEEDDFDVDQLSKTLHSTYGENKEPVQEEAPSAPPPQAWARKEVSGDKEQSHVQIGGHRGVEEDDIDVDQLVGILKSTQSEGPSELEKVGLECLKDVGINNEFMDYTVNVLQRYALLNDSQIFQQDIQILSNLQGSLREVGNELSKLISADGKIDARGLSAYLSSEAFDAHVTNLAVALAAFMNINAKLTTPDPKTGKSPLDVINASPATKRADARNILNTLGRCNEMLPRLVLQVKAMAKHAVGEQNENLYHALAAINVHEAGILAKKSACELETVGKLLDACIEPASKKRIAFLRTDQRVEFVAGRLVLKPVGFMPGTRAAIKEAGAREILETLKAAKKNSVTGEAYHSIIQKLQNMPDFTKLLTKKDGTLTELGELFEDIKAPTFGAGTKELLKGLGGLEPEEVQESIEPEEIT